MDVYSEIEIEALAFETRGLEQEAEAVIGEDMSELRAELSIIGTALNPTQNFDLYMEEWLGDGLGANLDIGTDAANWLSEFMGADLAIEVIDTVAPDDLSAPALQEKSKVLFTEDIDEVVSTGTRNTSWDYDYLAILNFIAAMESMSESVSVRDIGVVGEDAPAVGSGDNEDDEGEEEDDTPCFDWDLDGVFDINSDGDSNDEAQYIAAALAAGFGYVGALPAASYFAWVAAYAQYVDANPQLGIGIDRCA